MNKIFSLAALLVGLLIVPLGIGAISAETQPEQAIQTTATYRITFDATWSNATHPWPNFPGSDHWSPLVGTMHNDTVHLWQVGALATPGIRSVAETGATGTVQGEVNSAIAAGNANGWIRQGFSPFSGVSSATVEISADPDFPLLSLATMIAPSPDWFSGIDSVSLLDGDGNWIAEIVQPVYPYDAGTDSGADYGSPNQVTVPSAPIADYTGVAPFSAEPVGTVTITLLSPLPELPEKTYLPFVTR